MADLTHRESASYSKITNDAEANTVSVSPNGDLGSSDIVNSTYESGALSVGTTAVKACVGANNLLNRKRLILFNRGNKTTYYGPSYVTSNGATQGIPIEQSEFLVLDVGDNVDIYLITDTGTSDLIVQEMA